jgi:hypothetical protein
VRIGSCAVLPSLLSLPPLHARIVVLVLLGALDSPTDRLNWFQSCRLVPSAHQIYSGPLFLERRSRKCFIYLTTFYLAQTLVSNYKVISGLICVEVLRKTTKKLSEDSLYPGTGLNPGVLLTRPRRSISLYGS